MPYNPEEEVIPVFFAKVDRREDGWKVDLYHRGVWVQGGDGEHIDWEEATFVYTVGIGLTESQATFLAADFARVICSVTNYYDSGYPNPERQRRRPTNFLSHLDTSVNTLTDEQKANALAAVIGITSY